MAARPPPAGGSSSSTPTTWAKVVDRSASVMEFHPETELKDGKISVIIPENIIRDAPPLWKNYVLGHFIGPVPHIGKIHAIVNKIWNEEGKKARIDVNFLTESAALFRIDDDTVRGRVLKRAFWHIAEIPLVVHEWNPENAQKKLDLTSIPLWVDFKHVPNHLFSVKGLSYLSSVIGKPIRLHPNTERCKLLDVARVLVEVDLTKTLHTQISVQEGSGSEVTIRISYPWLPPRCSGCLKWGHTDKVCPTNQNEVKAKEVVLPQQVLLQQAPSNQSSGKTVETSTTTLIPEVYPILPDLDHLTSAEPYSVTNKTESSIITPDSALSGNAMDVEFPHLQSKPVAAATKEHSSNNEWHVVQRNTKGGSPRSSPRSSPPSPIFQSSKQSVSPASFEVLADIREEGEINEDDEQVLSLCIPEKSIKTQPKGKQHKPGKRQIVRSKDLALAVALSALSKKASSRKH